MRNNIVKETYSKNKGDKMKMFSKTILFGSMVLGISGAAFAQSNTQYCHDYATQVVSPLREGNEFQRISKDIKYKIYWAECQMPIAEAASRFASAITAANQLALHAQMNYSPISATINSDMNRLVNALNGLRSFLNVRVETIGYSQEAMDALVEVEQLVKSVN